MFSLKKKFFFIFCLFIISIETYGQDSLNTKSYFFYINLAELAITEGNTESALINFEKAFNLLKSPFSKDLYNYSVCCQIGHKKKKLFSALSTLFLNGLTINSLKQDSVFLKYLSFKDWRFLENKFSRNHKIFILSKNISLLKTLDSLASKDQLFRRKKGSYKLYGDTIKIIDKSNSLFLSNLIEKNGFPSEFQTGISDSSVNRPNFCIVITHQNNYNKSVDFSDILKKAVWQGKLDPHIASYLIDLQQNTNNYNITSVYRVFCESKSDCENKSFSHLVGKWVYRTPNNDLINFYNKNRNSLFLESIEDYRKKVIFGLKNKRFRFPYDGGVLTPYAATILDWR